MRKHTTFTILLLIGANASANVIFPAFTAPYISALIFPTALLAVLAVEGAIYKHLNRSLSISRTALLVVATNLVSWLGGVIITGLMPSGLSTNEQGILTSGPDFNLYATLGFGVAYILSILIEAAVLKLISIKMALISSIKMSFLSNTASYIVLSLMVWQLK